MVQRLLPLVYRLAHLDAASLAELEHPESMYNTGWSHGREKMGDQPDLCKGSFYANPVYDEPHPDAARYPFFYPPNLWPRRALPELEPAFKALGTTMYGVVALLARQIDALVPRHVPGYAAGTLERQVRSTRKIKARGLYYYPMDRHEAARQDWIGWHNDSGFLTALTGAMFFDEATGRPMANPDPEGGLWVVDRHSQAVKVDIPAGACVVQWCVHGARLRAVRPHTPTAAASACKSPRADCWWRRRIQCGPRLRPTVAPWVVRPFPSLWTRTRRSRWTRRPA